MSSSFSIVSYLSTGLHFVIAIVFLVVTITVVQKRRPDAGALLVLANVGSIVLIIATPIAYALFGGRGMDAIALIQLGLTGVGAVIQVLVILSVTKLANPPPAPPYAPVDPRRF